MEYWQKGRTSRKIVRENGAMEERQESVVFWPAKVMQRFEASSRGGEKTLILHVAVVVNQGKTS
jgi:hypothetical protein